MSHKENASQARQAIGAGREQKKTDYKAILEEIKNEGQEFNAESRTNTAMKLALQAVPISTS